MDSGNNSVPLATVTRGGIVESLHRGYVAVVDAAGRVLWGAGDPCHVTYYRSSAKPIQALPIVASGAVDRFGITQLELAVICRLPSRARLSRGGRQEHPGQDWA